MKTEKYKILSLENVETAPSSVFLNLYLFVKAVITYS
jgi:hypothetical protein